VRKLAFDLLGDRDPRKDIGLDAWGQLLGTQYGHDLAASALRKHFSARELTPAWFADRLLDERSKVFDFVSDLLTKVHTHKSLGAAFFRDLLDDPRLTHNAAKFALEALTRFPGRGLRPRVPRAHGPPPERPRDDPAVDRRGADQGRGHRRRFLARRRLPDHLGRRPLY
jgi:hypothetical protein